MTISAVNFGNNVQTAPQTTAKKKMDPVKKGAIIGAGVQTAWAGAGLLVAKKAAATANTTLTDIIKTTYGSTSKFIGTVAVGIVINALIGSGIGQLVKNGQEKKAAKEAATQDTKQLNQQV